MLGDLREGRGGRDGLDGGEFEVCFPLRCRCPLTNWLFAPITSKRSTKTVDVVSLLLFVFPSFVAVAAVAVVDINSTIPFPYPNMIDRSSFDTIYVN